MDWLDINVSGYRIVPLHLLLMLTLYVFSFQSANGSLMSRKYSQTRFSTSLVDPLNNSLEISLYKTFTSFGDNE